jgi:hypothetical protein
MPKKSFTGKLHRTIEQQDQTLQDRFTAADSVLLNSPKEELKKHAVKPVDKTSKKKSAIKPVFRDGDLVIRDTFSMPVGDYELIDTLRGKALKQMMTVTKSEIVRAGLLLLDSLEGKDLKTALIRVEKVKTGRRPQ